VEILFVHWRRARKSKIFRRPTILAGGGAGLQLGHHIVAPKDTPLCNAWLTLLQGVGVKTERHGDSTGVLKEILA
jgi:hypothetical protein